jgi:hypothetical protein
MRLRPEKVVAPPPRPQFVYALADVSKGRSLIRMGAPVRRDHPCVIERPDLFEVRYPLIEELNGG